MARPSECTRVHTRLLKCTLETESSRAYWQQSATGRENASARAAFEGYWFGAKSLARNRVLLTCLRARFDAFAPALQALGLWTDMDPSTRQLVCHWHLQLADPLYRAFTGDYLVERHSRLPVAVSHGPVVSWVVGQGAGRWGMSTAIQFASKLLSSARAAGLIASSRDPRPLSYPRVGNPALAYLMYLLRGVDFAGSLLENPYLASVGLAGSALEDRLKAIGEMRFRRQGDLIDFGWRYSDLLAWAEASVVERPQACAGGCG